MICNRTSARLPGGSGVFWRLVLAAIFFCTGGNLLAAGRPADKPLATGATFVPVLPPTPTVAEARQIVVAYMTEMATVEWVCQTAMDFTQAKPYTKTLIYRPGITYIGLPYVSNHDGVELFRYHLDGNKVYTGPTTYANCLGVSCAPAIKVAYRTVSPTVAFGGTPNILPHARKGTVAVGDYQWEADTPADATLTKDIVCKSSSNAILEAYAMLQPADTVATRKEAGTSIFGHARLVSSRPVVVRGADGKIDPSESHLHVIEQCGSFNKDADCNTTWRVNKKYTFADLIDKYYVPLTLEEFKTGKFAPAEIAVTGLTLPEDITSTNRLKGIVTSNFVINEVDATIYLADGRAVSQIRSCPQSKQYELGKIAFDNDVTRLPSGTYRFVLTIKIGYGDYVHANYIFRR
jgi:hypothetical protein